MNMNFKKNVHVQDMFTHCYTIYLMSKSICSVLLKKGNVVFYFHYMFLCIHQNPLLIVDE